MLIIYNTLSKKEEVFRKHFNIQEGQKVVICAGLYFRRKGIEDFVEVARRMPDVRFIWLGSINKWIIPRKIRNLVLFNHPKNVEFPGYFKGAVFEGAMSGSSLFFFPSYEDGATNEENYGRQYLEDPSLAQMTAVRERQIGHPWARYVYNLSQDIVYGIQETAWILYGDDFKQSHYEFLTAVE